MILPRKHINEVIQETRNDLQAKRDKSRVYQLKSKFTKLDNEQLGGFPVNTINVLGGASASGKSTLLRCLIDSMIELNDIAMSVNIFSFEMLATDEMIRKLKAVTGATKQEIHGLVDISLEEYDYFVSTLDGFKISNPNVNVNYIDVPGSPEDIDESMRHYYDYDKCGKDKIFLTSTDHLLLIEGDDDKGKIDKMYKKKIKFKKEYESTIHIDLAQLNREVFKTERIQIPVMHKPDATCLMASSAIYQAADLVGIIHQPAKLGIKNYTQHKLPTVYRNTEIDKDLPIPYFHIIKNRNDEDGKTFQLDNQLYKYNFEEM